MPVYQGDFNGDGRIDIITWIDDQTFQTCLTDDRRCSCSIQNLQIPPSTCNNSPADCEDFKSSLAKFEILVADIDGDGRADLVRRRDKFEDQSGQGALSRRMESLLCALQRHGRRLAVP